jgi:hypothetical protein
MQMSVDKLYEKFKEIKHAKGMKGKKTIAARVDIDAKTKVVKIEAPKESSFMPLTAPIKLMVLYVDMKASLKCLHKWSSKTLNIQVLIIRVIF